MTHFIATDVVTRTRGLAAVPEHTSLSPSRAIGSFAV